MAKGSPVIAAFTGGEWDSILDGRVDLDGYRTACKTLENFIPTVQGPIRRRGGTRYIGEVQDSTRRTWLLRWQRSAGNAYILEFGHQTIRFYKDRGRLLLGSTPSAWVTATAYAVGDLVRNGGVNYYCFDAHTSGGGTEPGVGGSWTARWHQLEDDIYEIPSPYTANDLITNQGRLALKAVQVGATMYLVHKDYAPRKLIRSADTNWRLEVVELSGGPFQDINVTSTTVYATAATGSSVTLMASAAVFNSDMEGSLFYLERETEDDTLSWEPGKSITSGDFRRSLGLEYEALNSATTGTLQPVHISGAVYDGDSGVRWRYRSPGYGFVRLDTVSSSTKAIGTVEQRLPQAAVGSGNASENWALSLFSDDAGWPSSVSFFRGRLVFAKDETLCFSVSHDFENFEDKFYGTVTDDMAVTVTIASTKANSINWLVPTSNGLILGTDSEELVCAETSQSIPFGPSNVGVNPQTAIGSAPDIMPLQINDQALYLQRDGRTVREIGYSYEVNGYRTRNMSVRSPHVTLGGIRDWSFAQSPDSVAWGCTIDKGALFAFTYDREQDVYAWHRHPLGGSGIVESIETMPAPDNSRDDVYLIVRRTINGQSVRYVEYITAGYEDGDDIEDSFFVDCGLTYDGAATTTITGLGHLEGATVAILADGSPHDSKTVSSGQITLDRSASVVQVGFAMTSKCLPMRVEAGAADGTSQGKTKRFNKVVFRLVDTVGFKCGPDKNNLEQQDFRDSSDDMDAPIQPYTGDWLVEWPGGYETDGYIWFVQDQPLPATLVAIMPQVTTQDTR